MKRFTVEVTAQVEDTVVVDAEDADDAHDQAYDAVLQRLACFRPHKPLVDDVPNAVVETTIREGAAVDARPATYVCHHCNKPSPKEEWGPGWMTCPNCGKRWLSVSEVAELLFEVINTADPSVPDEMAAVEETIARFEGLGYTVGVEAARRLLTRKRPPEQ